MGSTVLSVMKIIGFQNSAAVDDTWIRAYAAPFETPEESIGALEFPLDAYHARIRDYTIEGVGGLAALKSKPAMLAEGLCDHAIPPAVAIADFEGVWPGRPIVRLPGVGHFCQEDAPETLVALDRAVRAVESVSRAACRPFKWARGAAEDTDRGTPGQARGRGVPVELGRLVRVAGRRHALARDSRHRVARALAGP